MTRGQIIGVAIVAVGIALAVAGAIASSHKSSAPPAATPESCLAAAGLSDISQRDASTWRGFHEVPFFAVFVDDAGSPAAAERQVADADLVIGQASGRFAVTGPSAGTDDGGAVAAVAACLTG